MLIWLIPIQPRLRETPRIASLFKYTTTGLTGLTGLTGSALPLVVMVSHLLHCLLMAQVWAFTQRSSYYLYLMISDGCPLPTDRLPLLAAALLTTGAVSSPHLSLCLFDQALITLFIVPQSHAVENDQGCPVGWTLFGTRCFKFFDSTLTWMNAEKSCQSHGANLVSIHSAEEHDFIVDLIKKATGENQWTWIGGHDAVVEKQWMWTDGSVWDYSNWLKGQPSNHGGNEHVAMINWLEPLWNDAPEHSTMAYICAKDPPPKPKVTLGHVLYECTPHM
uniref:C-type lectin domain-containing protein n=1 Tax=Neogobius melanostomus TaxID=47308 RepID=A0A8C6WES5_9GOBI